LNLTATTSNIPSWYTVFSGQISLWPTPASSGNTIYIAQKSKVIDLSIADYTTGSIVSVANGGTAVIGSGTTWTSQMVGRFIQITLSNTANTGDGMWYEIAGVGSATTLTLVRAYGGTAIAAGSATYTIGQMSLLPESYQGMPWNGAIATYWEKEADTRSVPFREAYDRDLKDLTDSYSAPTASMVLDNGEDRSIINPNLTISL
jgi:hypothetical protein